MKAVDDNVVVVFEDAAAWECAVEREDLLKGTNPYVILKDDSLGVPEEAARVPVEIRQKIMMESPEPFSTWMRVNGNEWKCVKYSSNVDGIVDAVFASNFQTRVQQLQYVLVALGCKRIELSSSEIRARERDRELVHMGKVAGKHPAGELSVEESFLQNRGEEYKTIIRQNLCVEYPQCDEFDRQNAEQIIEKYGFSGNCVLKQILDARNLGRTGPAKHIRYNFTGEFIGTNKSAVSAAVKVSAAIQKLPVEADLDAKLEKRFNEHLSVIQTLSIEIDNE